MYNCTPLNVDSLKKYIHYSVSDQQLKKQLIKIIKSRGSTVKYFVHNTVGTYLETF